MIFDFGPLTSYELRMLRVYHNHTINLPHAFEIKEEHVSANTNISSVALGFGCFFGFLTSLSATSLYRGRVPRLTGDNFTCCHAETERRVFLFGWLVDFLTSSSATSLHRGRVARLTSDTFTCCHARDRAGRP